MGIAQSSSKEPIEVFRVAFCRGRGWAVLPGDQTRTINRLQLVFDDGGYEFHTLSAATALFSTRARPAICGWPYSLSIVSLAGDK